MTATWSYAATGLSIALIGLAVGRQMVPPQNRPNILRGKIGETLFGAIGLLLTVQLLFFGFRLFWDNGFWGILQMFIVSVLVGFVANIRWLQNAITPGICVCLGIFQAIKIW